jgi:tripartite-type tricarboxylate transporter receptor subunit TctC
MLSRRAWLDDGLLAPTLAHAQGTQGFPSRNLTVIVPFAPGASADGSRASLAKSRATP